MAADRDFVLSAELLDEVTDRRARGHAWEALAADLKLSTGELRRAARAHPEYEAALARATREVEGEAAAELVAALRARLRAAEPNAAQAAAQTLARHLSDASRDRTRAEVERLRADVARERLQAKRASEEEEVVGPPPFQWTEPPEVIEARRAGRAAAGPSVVWLWGGQHGIGGTEPDATDTPLWLFEDHTVRGRHLYWAARQNPDEPIPTLSADQRRDLTAVGEKGFDRVTG